jgi:hypothetical protein
MEPLVGDDALRSPARPLAAVIGQYHEIDFPAPAVD